MITAMNRSFAIFFLGAASPLAAAAADFNAATATNQVGLALFRQLAPGKSAENLVLSPYSIESALALVYAGAEGTTRSEMSRALQFPADDEPVKSAFAKLRSQLDQVAQQSKAAAKRQSESGGRVDVIE